MCVGFSVFRLNTGIQVETESGAVAKKRTMTCGTQVHPYEVRIWVFGIRIWASQARDKIGGGVWVYGCMDIGTNRFPAVRVSFSLGPLPQKEKSV